MENNTHQTTDDLHGQLNEQLEFLKSSAEAYDKGFTSEAKRMTTAIRILLHDTSTSHSLLSQLDLKNRKFLSTSFKMPNAIENEKQVGSYAGLISIPLGTGTNDYIPNLDSLPDNITGYIDFDDYWSEIIFIDNEKNSHNRKNIILSIANQDGGSHVDPSLNEKYYKLSRQNSLGWNTSDAEGEWIPAGKAELAAVRQITHELLRTLVVDYPRKEAITKGDGIMIGGAGVILGFQSNQKICKVGRRAFCPCGSGKKYKNCCEKK